MAGLEIKNAQQPDERRSMSGKGEVQIVKIGDQSAMAGSWEPGWRWSEHMRPVAGTDSCEATHLIYAISGTMHVVMNDGTEGDIGPGDFASINPGHDAWVVGDEPFVGVDFGGYAQYAKGSQ
jgi:quercetin dioxygenase-like cupin family protein